jgi:hypothetical protein
MSAWKNSLVVLIAIFLGVTFLIFLVTGYTALYWAWTRGNLGLCLICRGPGISECWP